MTAQTDTPDRSDMVAWMTAAAERGDWSRPHITDHHIGETTASAISENVEKTPLYRLKLGDSTVEAWRVDGEYDALHVRTDPGRDRLHRLPYYGEACIDFRYWLLQAEINGADLTVEHVHGDVLDAVVSMSPPEWEDDIEALVEKYSTE